MQSNAVEIFVLSGSRCMKANWTVHKMEKVLITSTLTKNEKLQYALIHLFYWLKFVVIEMSCITIGLGYVYSERCHKECQTHRELSTNSALCSMEHCSVFKPIALVLSAFSSILFFWRQDQTAVSSHKDLTKNSAKLPDISQRSWRLNLHSSSWQKEQINAKIVLLC